MGCFRFCEARFLPCYSDDVLLEGVDSLGCKYLAN